MMTPKEFESQYSAGLSLEKFRKHFLMKESICYYCYPDDIRGISPSGKKAVVLVTRGYSSIITDPTESINFGGLIAIGWFRDPNAKEVTIWKIKSISKYPGSSVQTRMFNVEFERSVTW